MIKIVTNKTPVTGTFFNRIYQPLFALTKYYPNEFEIMVADDNGMADATIGANIYFTCSPVHYEVMKLLREFNEKEQAEGLPKLKIIADFDDAPFELIPASIPQSYVMIGDKEKYVTFDDGATVNWTDKVTEINVYGMPYKFDIERNKKTRDDIKGIREFVDGITVTTDYMADKYKEFNKNVTVLPNMVDLSLYKQVVNEDDTFRIGWVIGGSHYDDYAICKDTFISFLKGEPKARLVIMTQMEIEAEEFGEVAGQVEVVPGVKITQGYHNMFSNLKLDLGFAFVADSEFNKCKSNLKYLEYGACNVPILASETLYNNSVTDKVNGFLYKDLDEMRNYLYYLSKRKELCRKVGKEAFEHVKNCYSDYVIAKKYYDYFKAVVNV